MPTPCLFFLVALLPGLEANGRWMLISTTFPDPLKIRECMREVTLDGNVQDDDKTVIMKQEQLTRTAQQFGRCLVESVSKYGDWIFDTTKSAPLKKGELWSNNEISVAYPAGVHISPCAPPAYNFRERWESLSHVEKVKLLWSCVSCIVKTHPDFGQEKLWNTFLCSTFQAILKNTNPPMSTVLRFIFKALSLCEEETLAVDAH